jgi:hypothetical protein
MGKQHGRITKVIVEKGRNFLQYFKLWSFEVEDTAPVKLFTRYSLSQAVGLERLSPSSSNGSILRIDPITGMLTL